MSEHALSMVKGALAFSSLYLLLKCVKRLEHDDSSAVTSRMCTWSMGALGAGFAVLVGASICEAKC